MAKRPALSKAEMAVARRLWDLGGGTVREVLQSMEQPIAYKTLQTYLRRLEAKGYVTATRAGKAIHYAARAQPRTVIQDAVSDFVSRLFAGDAIPLVEHLIQGQDLTADEVARIRNMLDELPKQAGAKK